MSNNIYGMSGDTLNVRLGCLNSFENFNENEYKMVMEFIKMNSTKYNDFETIVSALEAEKGMRASNLLTALRGVFNNETMGEFIINNTDYKYAVINPQEKYIYTLVKDAKEATKLMDKVIPPSIICKLKFEKGKLSGIPYKPAPPTAKQLQLIKELGLSQTFRGTTAAEAYKFIEEALKNNKPDKRNTLPASEKQLKLIKLIHEKTGANFTGTTMLDANKFIDANWQDFTQK